MFPIPRRIHLHENHKNQPNVGKYTGPMDGMGIKDGDFPLLLLMVQKSGAYQIEIYETMKPWQENEIFSILMVDSPAWPT